MSWTGARAREESRDLVSVFALAPESRIAGDPLYQPHSEPVYFVVARLAPIGKWCLAPAVARIQRNPSANKVFDSFMRRDHRPCKREVQLVSAVLVNCVQVQPVPYQHVYDRGLQPPNEKLRASGLINRSSGLQQHASVFDSAHRCPVGR